MKPLGQEDDQFGMLGVNGATQVKEKTTTDHLLEQKKAKMMTIGLQPAVRGS